MKDRPHPEYDALGIREGGFLIFPKLQTSLDYDYNIYAEQTDKASDGNFEATGSVQAKSQWSRNSLNALATVTRDQFFSHSTENTTQYTFETDGRYDILRKSTSRDKANTII